MTVAPDKRVRNDTLRTVRLSMRMSQSEFAAAIRRAGAAVGEPNTCNKRLVQKWESGEHAVCRLNYRRALQAVTAVPYGRLGFRDARPGPVTPVYPPREVTGRPANPKADAPGESTNRLRYALDRRDGADDKTLGFIEATTALLFGREHHEPARTLAPVLDQHTAQIAAVLAATRHKGLRRRLAATGGQCAALAGWLAFDRGHPATAHHHWDNALVSARYADDAPLLACILTFMSYTAEDRGDPSAAWQLARTAVTQAGAHPAVRAWTRVRAAQLAATLGEHRAALADLDGARDLAGKITAAADPAPPWIAFFDPCTLAVMAAVAYTRLGDLRSARDAARTALDTLGTEQVKTRALALAETARTAALIGDIDHAATTAIKAADLAERLEAALALRTLRAVAQLLRPHRSAPLVQDALQRLAVTPQPQPSLIP